MEENKTITLKEILPLAWITLVFIMWSIYMSSYIIFSKQVGKKKISDERAINILNKCKNKLNIKRKITIIEQEKIKTPAIFGILNIRILVEKSILQMTDKQIEYIFTHELIHYKKRDNIKNIIFTILKSIYIFNPIIWAIIKQIRKDIEIEVDEKVIETFTEQEKKDYCKLLLELLARENNLILREVLCISEEKSNLERRIDMVKISEKLKKNKIKIAIGVIVLIIIIGGVFFTKGYQKQYENPPMLYIENEDGTKQAMLPISYEWEYKGQTKKYDIEKDFKTMEYDDEYIICLKKGENKKLVTNENYKMEHVFNNIYSVTNGDVIERSGGDSHGAIMTEYSLFGEFDVGEFIEKIKINYYKQGTVTYAIKMLVFDDENVDEYKKLLNTKLEEKDKIYKIVDTLEFSHHLQGIEIKDGELVLNYDYYIDKQSSYENNLSLFTLIDDLEKITYTFNHKKTQVLNKETQQSEEKEIGELQVTRDEINSANKVTTKTFEEFIRNYR